jgi:hypothetical protein
MNRKFGELVKGLAPSVKWPYYERLIGIHAGLFCIALVTILTLPARAQLGPLIELSQPNPLAGCNSGFQPPGTMTLNDAAEPTVAVNPVHPNNMVAGWIGGSFQNVMSAASFDGGFTWQQVPLPLTTCAAGLPYGGGGDPYLVFAPNGDLYAGAVVGFSFSAKLIAVCKSTDGGLHWSNPTLLTSEVEPTNDGESLATDPSDSHFVYATWSQSDLKTRSSISFARSINGGQSWEPARTIVQSPPQNFTPTTQPIVFPDGTLVVLYQLQVQSPNKPVTQYSIQLVRSSDHGQSWSAPAQALVTIPLLQPNTSGEALIVDPETGQPVRDTFTPTFAMDPRSGNIYTVWEDGRFSNFQYNDIAFSMSSDRGVTWSTPIRINQTPRNIPPGNRQSFFATVAVAANGTIGVSYYDFRFNTPAPGLPTDCWLVQCHPTSNKSAADPGNWGNEVRLTDTSFNLEACAIVIDGFFLGDYFGLAPAGGGGFIATFSAVDQNGHTSIFSRRVGL